MKRIYRMLEKRGERGATLVISTLILALLTIFVAAALTNSSSNAISVNNDAASGEAFYAAYSGLEMMTKKFSDFFVNNTRLSPDQIDVIKAYYPDINGIKFDQNLRFIRRVSDGPDGTIELKFGPYAGLRVLRDAYFFSSTATTRTGVQVQLTRGFYNNLIPIFQFGIFSTRDLEFYNGPPFNFGGRVHANGNIYMNASGDLIFTDRITLTGQLVRDVLRNGFARGTTNIVTVNDPSGTPRFLQNPVGGAIGTGNYQGSGSLRGGPQATAFTPLGQPIKTADNNYFFTNILPPLGGQLIIKAPPLRLPFENSSGINSGRNNPIELIRRGLPGEDPSINPLAAARYFFKPGLRVSLSDSQAQLPGGNGGVNLAQLSNSATGGDGRSGYVPRRLGNIQASRVNGHRVRGWIKIETVNQDSLGNVTAADVTEAVLALGITRYEPDNPVTANTDLTNLRAAYLNMLPVGVQLDDSNSVFRLQRYSIPTNSNPPAPTDPQPIPIASGAGQMADDDTAGTNNGNRTRNHLRRRATATQEAGSYIPDDFGAPPSAPVVPGNACGNNNNYDAPAVIAQNCNRNLFNPNANQPLLVAYPINMFDVREGRFLDTAGSAVETRGVFSLIDIDMRNMTRLLTGVFDAAFNNAGIAFNSNLIPRTSNGWIVYVSDRRGDGCPACAVRPDNGKYDMEATYGTGYIPQGPPNTQTLFVIEDTNGNNIIENDIAGEGAAFNQIVDILDAITKGAWHPNAGNRISMTGAAGPPALVTTFRRAVRLTNGQDLNTSPNGDGSCSANPNELCQFRGVTIAAENPIYIQGNYNTTIPGVTGNPTPPANYTTREVPASVIADSVTLLSNNWQDVNSFVQPYNNPGNANDIQRDASNTAYRVAVLAGRARDGLYIGNNDAVPWGTKSNNGAGEPDDTRLYGGVHNFLRYLEDWSGQRLFYVGSIIDGWDSYQANGFYKCCTVVYKPPTRDYNFDVTFRDPSKLPPGTPNLQYVLFTSFRENVNPTLNILNQ